MKVQGKLNTHIIFKGVLMLFTKKYQNQSMLVETTACQSWPVFLRHSVLWRPVVLCCLIISHITLSMLSGHRVVRQDIRTRNTTEAMLLHVRVCLAVCHSLR